MKSSVAAEDKRKAPGEAPIRTSDGRNHQIQSRIVVVLAVLAARWHVLHADDLIAAQAFQVDVEAPQAVQVLPLILSPVSARIAQSRAESAGGSNR